MNLEGAIFVDNCVPCIISAVKTGNIIRAFRQKIDNLALSFIAPL
jgi:hypothetical protein